MKAASKQRERLVYRCGRTHPFRWGTGAKPTGRGFSWTDIEIASLTRMAIY